MTEDHVQTTAETRPAPGEFWERPGILGAQNALDVWASVKHARRSGTGGAVPTLETIFEMPRPEASRYVEGRGIVIEEMLTRVSTSSPTARPRLIEVGVELVLLRAGFPRSMRELLMAIYPRCGPYTRGCWLKGLEDPVASAVRAYRPKEVALIVGTSPSVRMQSRIDSLLNQGHREMVSEVSRFEALPAVVFAAAIEQITAPAKWKQNSNRDHLNRAFRKTQVQIPGLGSTEILVPRESCDWPRKEPDGARDDA